MMILTDKGIIEDKKMYLPKQQEYHQPEPQRVMAIPEPQRPKLDYLKPIKATFLIVAILGIIIITFSMARLSAKSFTVNTPVDVQGTTNIINHTINPVINNENTHEIDNNLNVTVEIPEGLIDDEFEDLLDDKLDDFKDDLLAEFEDLLDEYINCSS